MFLSPGTARTLIIGTPHGRHAPAAATVAAGIWRAGTGLRPRLLIVEAYLARKPLQRRDTVAGVRMGGKEVIHALPVERVYDVHMGHRRIALGRDIDLTASEAGDLVERRSQRQRIA